MTYSLDALLGAQTSGITPNPASAVKAKLEGRSIDTGTTPARFGSGGDADKDLTVVQQEEEFAKVNGISYTLPALLSGDSTPPTPSEEDVSVPGASGDQVEVGTELTRGAISSWWGGDVAAQRKRLFFAVIYLAPGDYHRFHSPASWVVERRRHFAGELYSVSPFLQNRLPNLFTLNERVALLGRWRHGMFSMTPVGATNVGSIKIHFDRELRTNSLTKETKAEQQKDGFAEATYRGASALLGGYPVVKGAEMGGFNLGSTIVLVFEAPGSSREMGEGGFRFVVKKGQKIKVGEALGYVEE
jgi:phosphatidylserine decarboxylase